MTMEAPIQVTTNEQGSQVVSARDLYEFLEVRERFTQWAERMLEEFNLNADYQAVPIFVPASNGIGGTHKTEYALTVDCAKHIAMMQRSPKGRQARDYFLEVERQFLAQLALASLNPASLSRKQLAQMVLDAEEKIEQLEEVITQQVEEVKQLEKVVVSQSKKVAYVDEVLTADSCWTTITLAKQLGMSAIALNKLLNQLHIQFKRDNHWVLYAQYENKGYTKTQTHTFERTDNRIGTSIQTVWTELGRAFVTHKVTKYRQQLLQSTQTPSLSQHGTSASA